MSAPDRGPFVRALAPVTADACRLPVTPEADVLRATTTRGLLTTYAALTHALGGARGRDAARSLRAQRDLVRDEILRRTGDAPG